VQSAFSGKKTVYIAHSGIEDIIVASEENPV
jgi:hypothetical protein